MAELTIKEIEQHLLVMDAVINDENYGIRSASVNFLETTRDALRQLLNATLAEREACAKILMVRAEHHRTELDSDISDTAKTVRDELQAELFELAAAIRGRSETDD